MLNRLGRLPWHPVLFAVVVVVTLWLDAAVSPYAVARSLLAAVALAVVLTLVASLALRSAVLGGLAASALIGVLWSKQVVAVVAAAPGRMGMLAILWILLIAGALFMAFRVARRAAPRVTASGIASFLNRASALLLIAAVALGVIRGHLGSLVSDLDQGGGLSALSAQTAGGPGGPDIYAILLDGYPRADVLEYAFDIDNSGFVGALEQRGFEVATASHSDYLWTHVSVPSALNLAYVEQIPAMADVIDGRAPQQPTIRSTMADNRAFQLAREQGYAAVAVGSGFEHVAPRRADAYLDGGQLNEFEISLLASTFAGDLVGALAPTLASSQQAHRILYNLRVLPEIAGASDRPPVLVFAHVPAPHQPTVFDADGDPIPVPLTETFFGDSPLERDEDPEEFLARYRAQLPYLNERILEAVDGILASSPEPPIIVLFADHGSASEIDWNAADPATVDPARLLERTGAFFAALTPEREGVFPDDISPVDIFRLLFDAYWQTDFGRAVPPPGGGQIEPVDASVLGRP